MIRLLALFVVIIAANCAIDDYVVVTWNMQGATSAGEVGTKWIYVRDLILRHGADVVVLQEAGAPRRIPTSDEIPIDDIDNPYNVDLSGLSAYEWDISTSTQYRIAYIYYLHTDTRGNRVNMAIVSVFRADRVVVLANATYGRPSMGLIYDNDAFFNFHANSGSSGGDAPSMINRIYQYTRSVNYIHSWMVFGDFNQYPGTLRSRLARDFPAIAGQVTTVNQNGRTQISGGNLDYAVGPVVNNPNPTYADIIDGHYFSYSDHIPISFSSCY